MDKYIRVFEVAELLDWSVIDLRKTGWSVESGTLQLEFSKHSPAGEDFSFVAYGATICELVSDVQWYANQFVVDDHVRVTMNMPGAPGLRELLDDAEAIHEMLKELAEDLGRAGLDAPRKGKTA